MSRTTSGQCWPNKSLLWWWHAPCTMARAAQKSGRLHGARFCAGVRVSLWPGGWGGPCGGEGGGVGGPVLSGEGELGGRCAWPLAEDACCHRLHGARGGGGEDAPWLLVVHVLHGGCFIVTAAGTSGTCPAALARHCGAKYVCRSGTKRPRHARVKLACEVILVEDWEAAPCPGYGPRGCPR
jgi:hypothetical protein